MTLEQLGNLGEFVGAFAVLVTLVYLAYQTRQNGELLRQSRDAQAATMATANVQNWHGFFSKIVEDSEVSMIVAKVQRGEEVEDHEIIRLEALLFMDFLTVENLVIQGKLNSWGEELSDDDVDRYCKFHIDWLMTSPSSRQWWQKNRIAFSQDFARLIDRLLEEHNQTAT